MSRHSYQFRRTRRSHVREQAVWPLPVLTAHPPVIITIDQVTKQALLAYGLSPLGDRSHAPASLYFMPESTPVLAIKGGVVQSADIHEGSGRVVIDHRNGFGTHYEGLHEIICPPKPRAVVKAGEVIGTLRSTGPSPAPLRFTLYRIDLFAEFPGPPYPVDPLDVLLGTVSIPFGMTKISSPRKEAA